MEQYLSSLPYSYAIQVPQLVAGQRYTGFIEIDTDSHFLARQRVMKVSGVSSEDNFPLPDATIEVSDLASGRRFMREPVKIPNWFGKGGLPYKIPLGGKVFYKRQVIEVTVINTGAGVLLPMALEWQGEKVFTTN